MARCISSMSPAWRYCRIVATPEHNVSAFGGFGRAFQRGVDPFRDEVEGGCAVHRDRCPGMVGKHKNWRVERRIAAPPPLPGVVGPRSSDWAEHVSTHDPRSNVDETACREVVIDADRAALTAMHLPKRTRGEGPFVERGASDAQRVVGTLVGAGAVTVDGYGEAVDAELGHGLAFLSALVNLMMPRFRTADSRSQLMAPLQKATLPWRSRSGSAYASRP